MQDLKGKKLLILAGSVHEIDLVRRAKELGVYTIVTDYYDPEISPAKKHADEYWNISWADIEALEKKCVEENVNGVTAGYSEAAVECLIKLCKRLNFPCYCTEEQLNITRQKILFKEECRKNEVPVVKEYASMDEVDSYPVIVKPVDRGGSIGITVASNRKQLEEAVSYAMEMSISKEIIIEKFISKGTKFDAYYGISEGEIVLLSTSDTINAMNNKEDKVVQSGWLLPSKYHNSFVDSIDSKIKQMIKKMKIKNGFIFFSGFADGNDFVFFETGFRLSGGHTYKYFEALGYPDIQDIFIYHALTGSTKCIEMNKKIDAELKAVIMNFYAKKGILTNLEGYDEIAKLEDCKFALPMCKLGYQCDEEKAILTKLAMFHVYNRDVDLLKNSADLVNKYFKAEDEIGKDMIFDRIDTSIILQWWKNEKRDW